MEDSLRDKRVKHWLAQGKEDIETADIMFRSKRWKYTIFMCRQSVEKYLKAIFLKNKGEFPPRIHNLFRLAEKIDKTLFPDGYLEFLSELSLYYIQSRYPEDIDKMAEINNKKRAEEILNETKEVIKWLKKTLL
ncbi:MAG: HEPN domain-containing protein [Candidatus Aminicenantes bacterium]|nr:HEPN domain-containing protein [Candidatus Aminicenantes bacterium]